MGRRTGDITVIITRNTLMRAGGIFETGIDFLISLSVVFQKDLSIIDFELNQFDDI